MTGRNNVVDGNFVYLSEAAKNWPVTQGDNRSNADGIAVSLEAPGNPPIGTVQIKNNIIVNTRACIRGQNNGRGVTFRRLRISNNTCVANDSGITLTSAGGGIANVVIQNNIITTTAAGATPTIQITPAATASRLRNSIYAAASDQFYWANQTPRTVLRAGRRHREVRSSFADPRLVNATACPGYRTIRTRGGSPISALSSRLCAYGIQPGCRQGADQIDSFRLNYRGTHRDIGAVEFAIPQMLESNDPSQPPPVCQSTFLPIEPVKGV